MTTTDRTDFPWATAELHLADAVNNGEYLLEHLRALQLFGRPALELGTTEHLGHMKWTAEQVLEVAGFCVADLRGIIEDCTALMEGREVTP